MSISVDQIFKELKGAYTALDMLMPEYKDDIDKVISLAYQVDHKTIRELLVEGPSWRERLIGTTFAFVNGPKKYYDDFIAALKVTGGMSIIPLCAAIATCVNHYNCEINESEFSELDPSYFDREMEFAVNKLFFYTGIKAVDLKGDGPNSGQSFEDHYEFYKSIGRV